MSDIAIIAASVQSALKDVAKQALALGTGLQNVAPGEKAGTPNNAIQYLLSTAENIAKIADKCGDIVSASTTTSQQWPET